MLAGALLFPAFLCGQTTGTGRLTNLSARARTVDGDGALTAGFVVAGPGNKRVLVRAAGPALAAFGVPDALAEARLELYEGTRLVATNSNWDAGSDGAVVEATARATGAFGFSRGSADAALVRTLAPGGYTARAVPARASTAAGVVLVEVYDAEPTAPGRLLNLSARARGGAGDDALIAGIVVAGEEPPRLLVRAAGPALLAFGLSDAMRDPQLELFRQDASVAINDDWQSNTNPAQVATVSTAMGAFPFAAGAKDAALLLPPAVGAFTAAVTPGSGAGGTALVEAYDTGEARGEIAARVFDLVGFARVSGHGLERVTGGGVPRQPYDPRTGEGEFWRIDEAVAAAASFPSQFRNALASDRPLVVELDVMLDLSRVASPNNGATAIAHPDLFAPGRTTGTIGLLGVASNKTIYSSNGAGGFRRGTLRIDGKVNIILRNLRFRELWEWDDATGGQYDRNDWDYLTILSRYSGADVTARAHHIWIDHCDFEKSYDGLLDVVQGADLVTVSWCKLAGVMSGETARWVRRQFEHLEANTAQFPNYRMMRESFGAATVRQREEFQFKGNLVGNSTEVLTAGRDRGHLNVTFHHNWYFNVDQRMPRMRFGNAHIFNLLADSAAGSALTGLNRDGVMATSGAAVRVEQSWFTGVRNPTVIQVGFEPPGTILLRNSIGFDPASGARTPLQLLHAGPGVTFAWNPPAPRTGVAGWPAADPELLPPGYTPPGMTLADYLDPAESLPNQLAWVGVLVPANATEARLWRARWQAAGP